MQIICNCLCCICYSTVIALFIVGMIEWKSNITQNYLDLDKIDTFGQNNYYCDGNYKNSEYEYFIKYDCFKFDSKIKCSDYCLNSNDIIEDKPTKPLTDEQLYKCLIIAINYNDSIIKNVYFNECYEIFDINNIMSTGKITPAWVSICIIGSIILALMYVFCTVVRIKITCNQNDNSTH